MCRSSRCLLVNRAVPRIFFHAYQFQAKVANSVKDAVEVGLIADLSGEDAVFIARFEGKPFEGGREVPAQTAPDRDPVPGRLHVPSDALWVDTHLEPSRVSGDHPCDRFHPGEQNLYRGGHGATINQRCAVP